ncbi:hypothetical protein OU415_02525 [Saccharopolyspora sp. WRP15-2]|uniref:HNH endonuclease n=1 Tax=Saccharopolyspora oryzae TaxID=2997343 RepID=A0ABT4URE7_9PSEU|nr:hypothetical protein [Saccharopolyspora oryzae]MDA3624293.1 hypothetical protein [Saccharopolyspora oryzae]
MNPSNPEDYVELSTYNWTLAVDDLADDQLRVIHVPNNLGDRVCGLCDHAAGHIAYLTWVQNPHVVSHDGGEDNWTKWGTLCWTCMLAIVAAGGHPIPALRAEP